ncbi:hypothetical protein N431DRAFT_485654 [Stipitochalara longipes BDJ]|nr:hypothetical protein N431DRAFT_485654 [Stipitochalara longipes BDJ]
MTSADPVALSSDIGTWIAVGITLIALIGIIGPWLALQAALSERNRALNLAQDIKERYITKGYGFSQKLRLFRRVRVPDLAPGYNGIPSNVEPLAIIPRASHLWTFEKRDYDKWNTGWAKVCELLGRYQTRKPNTNINEPLQLPKGGTMEVVNGHTALPVSQYWILVIGLLGRFGKRADNGVLQLPAFRQDLDEEREGVLGFTQRTFGRFQDATEKKFMKKSWTRRGSASLDRADSSAEWRSFPEERRSEERRSEERRLEERRDSEERRNSEERGKERGSASPGPIDSSSEEDWRGRGSASPSRTSSSSDFDLPSSARSILEDLMNSLKISLQITPSSYGDWMLSLSQPATLRGTTGALRSLGRRKSSSRILTALSFTPNNMGQLFPPETASRSEALPLRTLFWLANGFLPVGYEYDGYELKERVVCLEEPVSSDHIDSALLKRQPVTDRYFALEDAKDIPHSLRLSLDALDIQKYGIQYFHDISQTASLNNIEKKETEKKDGIVLGQKGGPRIHYRRKDVEENVAALLKLEWDPWGYLVWKRNTSGWTDMLSRAASLLSRRGTSTFIGELGHGLGLRVFEWKNWTDFNSKKTEDLIDLSERVCSWIKDPDVLSVKVEIATLFIVDDQFKSAVRRLFRDGDIPWGKGKQEASSAGVDAGQGTALTEGVVLNHASSRDIQKIDSYDIQFISSARTIRWKKLEKTIEYSLSQSGSSTKGSQKGIKLELADLQLISIWAACRAALWTSSLDSYPLLEFVKDLDEFVFVL